MHPVTRHQVEWPSEEGPLHLYEPTLSEVVAVSPSLAAYYNEPYNRAMLTNTRVLSASEVVEHYAEQWRDGGRPFLLESDGQLLGDADLRGFAARTAEFAILVGARVQQGRGLGRRFALMAHALAFGRLGLERIYASIIPANGPSQRLFAWLGYLDDQSPQARSHADEEDDLTLSVERGRFLELHGEALSPLRITAREVVSST